MIITRQSPFDLNIFLSKFWLSTNINYMFITKSKFLSNKDTQQDSKCQFVLHLGLSKGSGLSKPYPQYMQAKSRGGPN